MKVLLIGVTKKKEVFVQVNIENMEENNVREAFIKVVYDGDVKVLFREVDRLIVTVIFFVITVYEVKGGEDITFCINTGN